MFVPAAVAGNAILTSKSGVARSRGLPGFCRDPFRAGLQMSGAAQRHLSLGGPLSQQESASTPSTGVGAEAVRTDSAEAQDWQILPATAPEGCVAAVAVASSSKSGCSVGR
jgi:hypothetical protein